MTTTTVDLLRPPAERWNLTALQLEQAAQLMAAYGKDLNLPPHLTQMLAAAAEGFIRPDHWHELQALASTSNVPLTSAIIGNLYYDLSKVVLNQMLGCTAFAVETGTGILHARNLDWWTENAMLARYTMVTNFTGAQAGDFTAIGWPGFIGAFSGVAHGRFAVTLNAVLSMDPPQLASPVVFLMRTVLEEAPTYEAALEALAETPIPCDCLLLLTGTRPGEIAVIERTPSRHAIRSSRNGFISVTNGYLQLDAKGSTAPSALMGSSCSRLDHITAMVQAARPRDPETCLDCLSDSAVRMDMTVQQMVFNASTGEHWLR